MLAEANVGGGGRCLLKFRNKGIGGGRVGLLKLFIGLSTGPIGLELWIKMGLDIFGGLEENIEVPLKALSPDERLTMTGLVGASAKCTPRVLSSGFVSGAP